MNEPHLNELIAQAFSEANADTIRQIMTKLLREKLEQYDTRAIIERAVAAAIKPVVEEMLKDEAIAEKIYARAKQQLLIAMSSMEVRIPYR